MKNKLFLLLAFLIFCSHDMFLKMDSYFLEPNQDAVIHLYNGTFDKSENVISRDRMQLARMVGDGNSQDITEDQWSEKDSITILSFKTGEPGTYVAGVSTKARNIEMEAEDFNDYLKHDGVLDMLEQRRENGSLEEDAIESYSKHVKAIFQVGDKKTSDWDTALGYPIEFVPLSNPYESYTGDSLSVKLLLKGAPLANQLVYADYKASAKGHTHDEEEKAHSHGEGQEAHSHEMTSAEKHAQSHATGEAHELGEETATQEADHQHTSGQELITDQNGVINLKLTADGIWYLRTIHMTTVEEAALTHESNWATLTFEVTHGHNSTDGVEAHSHIEEDGIPSYVFWIGSLVILGGLFFYFSRKK